MRRAPLRPGAALADGLEVIAHLARNEALDVYDAWDAGRHCRVIAKALRPDRAAEPRRVERLRREGELLARLAHPHLVRAYETREAPRTIVVLETLSGETLDHFVHARSRRLPAVEVALLGGQLASAIRYLHAHGRLHLDLKPENVIVDAGFAKVLDLSLSREPGPGPPEYGTPRYLSPEQASGGEFTPASDVWGLGAVLFEAATGTTDFAAPVRRRRPRLPGLLAGAIDACLAPDPAARPELDAVLAACDVV